MLHPFEELPDDDDVAASADAGDAGQPDDESGGVDPSDEPDVAPATDSDTDSESESESESAVNPDLGPGSYGPEGHDHDHPIDDEEGRLRRQNVRVSVKYPIIVQIPGYPDMNSRTRDISATGIGFATRVPLTVDMEGTVEVTFPSWTLKKQFVVRFVKPILAGRQVGVQYAELTHDEHERVVKEVFAVQRSQLQSGRTAG